MTDSLVEPAAQAASAPSKADTWRSNFFPFRIVWFSIVALEISWLADLRMADTDIWVHLRSAQQLLTTHSFIRADSYTFTTASAPLLNFEWLSGLPYYFAFQTFGIRGLLAVYTVILWLVFAGVYYLALRRGANYGDAAMVTMAGVVLGSYSFGPRLFHFAWLCLVAQFLLLDRFQRSGKGLWMLPPLFALWINLHASWVLGFVVMGIYISFPALVEGQWNNNLVAERLGYRLNLESFVSTPLGLRSLY